MKYSLIVLTIACYLFLALTFLLDFSVPQKTQADAGLKDAGGGGLVVHEWGTFTSIAGKDGVAIDWRPLNGASDLPGFVYTVEKKQGFRGNFSDPGKGALARVRMETPVIYFYTGKEIEVDVKVDFPKGKVTEWYPQAGYVNGQFSATGRGRTETGINWGTIKLLPNAKENFLREVSYSHYYPARETDSVPVQICNTDKTKIETEKFLFYRGTGTFDLPLNVKLEGGKIALANGGSGEELKNLFVFENRGGKIGFRLIETLSKATVLERPETTQTLDRVLTELERILVAQGLYEKEAKAMIKTWQDSWFEEGLRVFYVLPRRATDEILPLTIVPKPNEVVRVLVGRAEVITPEMEKDVQKQIGLLRSESAAEREEAIVNLKKHGRFYEPILKSILQSETDEKVRAQIQKLISLS